MIYRIRGITAGGNLDIQAAPSFDRLEDALREIQRQIDSKWWVSAEIERIGDVDDLLPWHKVQELLAALK